MISGELASVDDATIDSWQPVLKSILNWYSPCDVYNADESGLFYIYCQMKPLQSKVILTKWESEANNS